jgi:hypothetical protein
MQPSRSRITFPTSSHHSTASALRRAAFCFRPETNAAVIASEPEFRQQLVDILYTAVEQLNYRKRQPLPFEGAKRFQRDSAPERSRGHQAKLELSIAAALLRAFELGRTGV